MRVTLVAILLLSLYGPVFAQSDGSSARLPKKKVTPRRPLTAVQEKQARDFARSCGASLVRGKVCLLRKRRWHGRCEAGNWCCRWRSTGSHNSTGSPDRQDSVNLSTSRLENERQKLRTKQASGTLL